MRPTTRTDWHRRVEATVERLHASLDDPVRLREVAAEAASSPFHFHRMFRALTGETLGHCVQRLRLERAAYQIEKSDRRVTDVALEAGYATPESFSKAFKAAFTIRPSAVRAQPAWNGLLPSRAGIHYSPDGSHGWFFIGETGETMDVKIVQLPPTRMFSLRNLGDYWQLPATWQRFLALLTQAGFEFGHDTTAMIVFHDHHPGVPMEAKRSDVSVSAGDRRIELCDGLFEQQTPGGLYAVTPHFGSYEEIGATWDAWRERWLPESGWIHDTTRPSLEWYQNDASVLPPELLLTLLCDPVRRE